MSNTSTLLATPHAERTDDEEIWVLPGLELSHDLVFTLGEWQAWREIERLLQSHGAEIVSFTLTRQEAGIILRCRAKAISAACVRRIAAHAQDANLAQTVNVEHLMLSKA